MKFFVVLALLCGIAYYGYGYYQKNTHPVPSFSIASSDLGNKLNISSSTDKLDKVASVLGANISTALESGQNYLSDVTGGRSQPIINELVQKTTDTLKDLPRKEADKIKYEFCKGVVTEYENKSTQN